jgi:hypothetical protein
MQPVATVEESREFDTRAHLRVPEATLVNRAGVATAHAAVDLMGGAYGRRVRATTEPMGAWRRGCYRGAVQLFRS